MKNTPTKNKKSVKSDPHAEIWILKLYVAGQTPKSIAALANLKKICNDQHLTRKYQIDVIDLQKQPALAKNDQILAIPTVVRQFPLPVKRLIGTLADTERVLIGLDIQPA